MIGNLSRGGSRQRRERYFKSILFRIINVKNILEALINVGCKEHERGTAASSSHTPSCYWISIGKRLFLSSDRGCHFGSFVTEVENYVTLYIALSHAESTMHEKDALFLFLFFLSSSFTLKIFAILKKRFKHDLMSEIIKVSKEGFLIDIKKMIYTTKL